MKNIAFSTRATTLLLAIVPAFAACSGKSPDQNIASQPAKVASLASDVDETTKLKIIAMNYSNASHTIVTDVTGISNCLKTAETFAQMVGRYVPQHPGSSMRDVRAVCIPQEGGKPVATYQCGPDKNRVTSCQLVPN